MSDRQLENKSCGNSTHKYPENERVDNGHYFFLSRWSELFEAIYIKLCADFYVGQLFVFPFSYYSRIFDLINHFVRIISRYIRMATIAMTMWLTRLALFHIYSLNDMLGPR